MLEVLASDPQIIKDLPSVLKQRDDLLIGVEQQKRVYRIYVRRGEQRPKGVKQKDESEKITAKEVSHGRNGS